MAGFIAPPVNVGKGATRGKLLTGTGTDEAGWNALPVSSVGTLGNASAAISGLLAALTTLGVDTSGIPAWNRGPDATRGQALGPSTGGSGVNSGPGFHILYGSVSTGTFYRINSPQGVLVDWALGHATFDPAGTDAARTLNYFTGAGNTAWTDDGATVYSIYQVDNIDAGGGSIGIHSRFGNYITLGSSAGADFTYERFTIEAGADVIDWDYQR